MKCSMCNSKKAKRFCSMVNSEICSLCCGSNRNLRKCNSNCEFYFKEETDRLVIKNPELTRVDNGEVYYLLVIVFCPIFLIY